MRTYQAWMSEYGRDHTHPTNQTIHLICVPAIMFSMLGLLWSIPAGPINVALIVIVGALGFYLSLKRSVFVIMTLVSGIMALLCHALFLRGILLPLSASIFVLAWIGQFIGHKIEGRKPAFLTDLVFLLIGPIWVLKELRLVVDDSSHNPQ